jgi:DNA-binding LytR/AlgR family response regulator
MKVNLNDILYIEGLDDYIKIYIQNQKTIVTRITMKGILEKLPTSDFVRIHRSFIVPINRIEKVRNKNVVIGDKELPIGKVHEDDVMKLIKPR